MKFLFQSKVTDLYRESVRLWEMGADAFQHAKTEMDALNIRFHQIYAPSRKTLAEDISQARAFVLTPEAASYCDSFRRDLKDENGFLTSVPFSFQSVWIEYDLLALLPSRVARWAEMEMPEDAASIYGMRGLLLKVNADGHLEAVMVRNNKGAVHGLSAIEIIDPIASVIVRLDENRIPTDGKMEVHPSPTARRAIAEIADHTGITKEDYVEMVQDDFENLSFEIVTVFAFLALLDARENGMRLDKIPRAIRRRLKRSEMYYDDKSEKVSVVYLDDLGRGHVEAVEDAVSGASSTSTAKRRSHWVRGHFVNRDRKVFWRKPHVRGGRTGDEHQVTLVKARLSQ